ncbi:hypothetical protein OpiT1DRAFT_01230 [Opitutaceae bacterium TAV1]|nr:hypothetical protein OpiT1DRAFT_01230 [Opitutaceae bacterium TAV1]
MIKKYIIPVAALVAGAIGALFYAARTTSGKKLLTKFEKKA